MYIYIYIHIYTPVGKSNQVAEIDKLIGSIRVYKETVLQCGDIGIYSRTFEC